MFLFQNFNSPNKKTLFYNFKTALKAENLDIETSLNPCSPTSKIVLIKDYSGEGGLQDLNL